MDRSSATKEVGGNEKRAKSMIQLWFLVLVKYLKDRRIYPA